MKRKSDNIALALAVASLLMHNAALHYTSYKPSSQIYKTTTPYTTPAKISAPQYELPDWENIIPAPSVLM